MFLLQIQKDFPLNLSRSTFTLFSGIFFVFVPRTFFFYIMRQPKKRLKKKKGIGYRLNNHLVRLVRMFEGLALVDHFTCLEDYLFKFKTAFTYIAFRCFFLNHENILFPTKFVTSDLKYHFCYVWNR